MENVTNYIWDFDGTLFDTYPGMVEAAQKALADHGYYPSLKEITFIMKKESTKSLREKFGLSDEAFTPLFHQYEKEIGKIAKPFPEAKTVLGQLKQEGKKHYVLTHRLTQSTWDLLAHYQMADLFEEVVGLDKAFPRKPDPASLNYLIKAHKMTKEQTIMIGDRSLDIEAGKRAGIKTCLYDRDHFLGSAGADWTVADLREILTIQGFE
ncbi:MULTISPECIES: HAD-IA family hydrolase [unclassified Enterococcus]|jgi:HAD superfamily hydrolase (TIGR01509 family)|uniref:HAD-IA family hydrolase n=1 Tax=unclassified Enterococcus TaxID=2608891 RepID=UPI003D29E81F